MRGRRLLPVAIAAVAGTLAAVLVASLSLVRCSAFARVADNVSSFLRESAAALEWRNSRR